ncbi:MAG: iron-sulfur cluster assembly scaffold protein [Chthonomonas sp.]|nr:iron-sulfur cluster assembly scaffold protein [Chthonomonas sp.]
MIIPLALDHIHNMRNVGPLPSATHYGVAGVPGDGPFMELWFQVSGENIERGAYKTYGCPTSIACGSLIAELLRGKPVATAHLWTEEDLKQLIGEIPEGKGDCPPRAIAALQSAFEKTT